MIHNPQFFFVFFSWCGKLILFFSETRQVAIAWDTKDINIYKYIHTYRHRYIFSSQRVGKTTVP